MARVEPRLHIAVGAGLDRTQPLDLFRASQTAGRAHNHPAHYAPKDLPMTHPLRSAAARPRRSRLLAALLATLVLAGLPGNIATPTPASRGCRGRPERACGRRDRAARPDQTTGPVRLQIPAINLDVPVIAVGWRLDVVNGVRTTAWDIPDDRAGWHMNSVGAGAAGNTTISGRQVGGAAVFLRRLPWGRFCRGPTGVSSLTDGDGIRLRLPHHPSHARPSPITGATPAEEAQAAPTLRP